MNNIKFRVISTFMDDLGRNKDLSLFRMMLSSSTIPLEGVTELELLQGNSTTSGVLNSWGSGWSTNSIVTTYVDSTTLKIEIDAKNVDHLNATKLVLGYSTSVNYDMTYPALVSDELSNFKLSDDYQVLVMYLKLPSNLLATLHDIEVVDGLTVDEVAFPNIIELDNGVGSYLSTYSVIEYLDRLKQSLPVMKNGAFFNSVGNLVHLRTLDNTPGPSLEFHAQLITTRVLNSLRAILPPVVNHLNSSSISSVLSANMGKYLNDKKLDLGDWSDDNYIGPTTPDSLRDFFDKLIPIIESFQVIKHTVVELGSWNMHTQNNISIPHEVSNWYGIVSVQVLIINDDLTTSENLDSTNGLISKTIGPTNVNISIQSNGTPWSNHYDDSINRGYLLIHTDTRIPSPGYQLPTIVLTRVNSGTEMRVGENYRVEASISQSMGEGIHSYQWSFNSNQITITDQGDTFIEFTPNSVINNLVVLYELIEVFLGSPQSPKVTNKSLGEVFPEHSTPIITDKIVNSGFSTRHWLDTKFRGPHVRLSTIHPSISELKIVTTHERPQGNYEYLIYDPNTDTYSEVTHLYNEVEPHQWLLFVPTDEGYDEEQLGGIRHHDTGTMVVELRAHIKLEGNPNVSNMFNIKMNGLIHDRGDQSSNLFIDFFDYSNSQYGILNYTPTGDPNSVTNLRMKIIGSYLGYTPHWYIVPSVDDSGTELIPFGEFGSSQPTVGTNTINEFLVTEKDLYTYQTNETTQDKYNTVVVVFTDSYGSLQGIRAASIKSPKLVLEKSIERVPNTSNKFMLTGTTSSSNSVVIEWIGFSGIVNPGLPSDPNPGGGSSGSGLPSGPSNGTFNLYKLSSELDNQGTLVGNFYWSESSWNSLNLGPSVLDPSGTTYFRIADKNSILSIRYKDEPNKVIGI